MLDPKSVKRIKLAVEAFERSNPDARPGQDQRPEDQTFARVKLFEIPSGGTWEEVASDKWRMVDCREVIKTAAATWAATDYRPVQTVWFVPELFGDETVEPTAVVSSDWVMAVWEFQSERWVALSFNIGGGGGTGGDCCGSCGDSVSEWIDNFQTYQDAENLTVYGYTATSPGNPIAANYSGSLIGVWLGSVTHFGPIAISRPFSIDCLKYNSFSFQAKLFARDAFGGGKFSFNFIGSVGGPNIPLEIISANVLGSIVRFKTLNGTDTDVSHTFAANDVFKVEFDIDSHDTVRTDDIAFDMEITTRGFINGTQVYTGSGTLSSTLSNYCNASYRVTEESLGRGDTITDMWVFKAT